MNRILLFLCCICVSWMARGQAAYEWRYWFDMGHAAGKTGLAIGERFTIETDASGLSDGFHAIYVQVADTAGRFSPPMAQLFYHTADRTIKQLYYWFDEDDSSRAIVPFPGEVVMIDVSGLQEGFHTFHSQVFDVTASNITTTMFIKIPQTENTGEMTCICTVDGKLVADEKLSAAGGLLRWNMDVSKMDVGIHKAMFQVITPSGAASSIAERYFVRTVTNKELGSMKCLYTIDNFETYHQAGTLSDGLFHFDLDVASIENGLHRIAYTLVSETGLTLPQQTAFFWKTPLGGDGIVQYDYWLNNKSDEVVSVTLSAPADPFQLIKLLPVTAEPIRSSCFHFDCKNGTPMMYAKNDIHFRFHDKNGCWVDANNQYVDYNVSKEVQPVGELLATQTFPMIEEDSIHWYTLNAEAGDSLTFKASQATSIQLFSPGGEELYSVSGSESVIFGGCHTWETGTHYLAVHDVTGSRPNITLDYEHIDKYAVLEQDVTHVGNGGFSTITFKGNGFDNLYAVDLFTTNGDTIHSLDVNQNSNVETAVTFDFTGAELGKYSVVFRFTEEDKYFPCHAIVEEAKDIELATTVTFPSAFPHGRSTTYTVKITNKGNMTAYSVPVYTWIMNKWDKNGIYHIEYDGLNLPGLFDGVDMESLSVSEKAELQALADEIGDAHYFMLFRAESEDSPGDSVWVRSNYFFTNIAPYETKTLKLTLSANEGVWAYFTVPEDWPEYSMKDEINVRGGTTGLKSAKRINGYCCYSDKIDCIATNLGAALDVASVFTGLFPQAATAINTLDCVVSGAGAANKTFKSIACDSKKESYNPWIAAGEVFVSTSQAGLSCIAAKLTKYGIKYLKTYDPELKSIGDMISRMVVALDAESFSLSALNGNNPFKCLTELTKPSPGCPPILQSGGNSGGGSWDPNDIFGYLSHAGSHFIADSVAYVNYTIEFENDTTLAMAAAHTIVIKDTLDRRYFDLNSFMPIAVKIGSHEVLLADRDISTMNGITTFLKTIDMRPAIYAIAQVEGTFNKQTGIAEWRFTSLDPMTMEPAEDVMQGILPVNYDGTLGIGEIMFEVGIKQGKADGTEIENRASIVFDANAPILTPIWTNIVDAVAPSSVIDNSWMVNDSTLRITADGFDERSGVWKYTWYVQAGENAPWWKEGETESPQFDYHIFDGIDYGFCVVATDSAGNVEQKVIERERGFKTYGQDFEDKIESLTPNPSPKGEGSVYDLSGRQIVNRKSSNSKYPRGIYVIDDKKVLKK